MELTIQELAAHVSMTARNIREWQTIGVLHPPHRRGRVAFYDDDHVNRIERIKSLRRDGFPLDVIRQFMERSEDTAAAVLTLSSAVLDPASNGGTMTLTRSELAARLGAGAEEAFAGSTLIEVADDTVTVTDVAMFDYVEKLVTIGLPIEALAPALEVVTEHQVRAVSALLEIYREAVWQPFADGGLPTAQWSSIAVTSGQMLELAIGLGGHIFRKATDIVVAEIAVQQATKLDSRDGLPDRSRNR